MPERSSHSPRLRRSTRLLIIAAAAVVLIAAAAAAAPWALERYANAQLADMRIYQGRIEGVELDPLTGTGAARGFLLDKRNGARQVFITADRIEVDLRYSELFSGRPVIDLHVEGCEVNLVLDPDESRRELGERLRWSEFLSNLPFEIGRFTAAGSAVLIHGVRGASEPIEFRDISLRVTGLDQGRDATDNRAGVASDRAGETSAGEAADAESPRQATTGTVGRGRLELEAVALDAPLTASGTFNPSLSDPAFDLEVHLGALPLQTANPWLTGFAGVDIEQGTVEADLAARLRREHLGGAIDARIIEAEFAESGDEEGGPLKKMVEAIADLGVRLFENDDGNWAQRLTLEAEVTIPEDPDLKATLGAIKDGFWTAIGNRQFEERDAAAEAE